MHFYGREADMHRQGKANGVLRAGLWALLLASAALLLSACAAPAATAPDPSAELSTPTPPPATADPLLTEDAEKIRISELMAKNRAVLRDEDGDFSDWIELENCSEQAVELGGWRLTDRETREGWTLPAVTLAAGERLLVFADGKDRAEGLHANFSLSQGESVYLYNRHGYLAGEAPCLSAEPDVSVCLDEAGDYVESLYPTPGFPNTGAGYSAWQSTLTPAGPLVINEVLVSNTVVTNVYAVGMSDWVEILNVSDEAVNLGDYFLSDDDDDYFLWRFPSVTLQPGQTYLVLCDPEPSEGSAVRCDRFGLSSVNEQLYLAKSDGTLTDYASLRDIPYRCSYGRMPGENGWFYFEVPGPGRPNERGYRRVACSPAAAEPDGVFEGVEGVTVTLEAPGTIYYTTDGTLPDAASAIYTEPLELTQTCVLRAINWETDAMPSRAATFSYFINEGHSLPVASLVSDDKLTFNGMYYYGSKGVETPGNLAFYAEDARFTIPCGIKMQGGTSLVLPKKNMSVRFRGRYGQETLSCDVFGGGVQEFTNLLLRAGQDYYSAVIRNELCQNLAMSASDALICQRNRYCVLYVDGKYYGIYALMEKSNEQLYADTIGVSRESVTTVEADHTLDTELFRDVLSFCLTKDMSDADNYAYISERMDLDSMIDWFLLEGYCANSDLTFGNLRYCRSTEGDGKWRFMFYDLDAAFHEPGLIYTNLLSQEQLKTKQICQVAAALLKNEDFRERLLLRAGELLNGPLTNDKALAEIDRLIAQIEPEVERDFAAHNVNAAAWRRHVRTLRSLFDPGDWRQQNIDMLCRLFRLSEQERARYFGE